MSELDLAGRVRSVLRARAEPLGLAVSLGTAVVSLSIYLMTPISWIPGADGLYSWAYARSLAFDGDIDFKNDYALCGDPFRIGVDRGTGHPDNIFYFGPAAVWVPVLGLLRLVLTGLPSRASCGPPFSTLTLGLSPLMAGITAYLCYRLARRWFSDGLSALAVALCVVGGPVARLATALPSYSHTTDALFVAALLVLTARALEGPPARHWTWVAAVLAVCIWQRLSNVLFAVIPIVAVLSRAKRAREVLGGFVAAGVGTIAGLVVYGAVYQYLYGSPFTFTHGRYFLQLVHPHPLLLSFDETQGLFYLYPVVWIAVLGLFPALRDRAARWVVVPLAAIGLAELYLSSAALDWAPARRLANLTPLWVVSVCFALRSGAARLRWGPRSRSAAGVLLAFPFCAASLGDAWGSSRPGQGTTITADVTNRLGRLGALPAEIVFSLRYHLPRDRFREASSPSWYTRDFRSLCWHRRDLPFADPRVARLSEGLSPVAGGMRPTGVRARLVFAAQWPFVTHAVVRAFGQGTLRVGEGRAWGEPLWFGEAQPLPARPGELVFTVPPGEVSSGIHEIVLDFAGADPRTVTVVSFAFDDRAPRRPAFER